MSPNFIVYRFPLFVVLFDKIGSNIASMFSFTSFYTIILPKDIAFSNAWINRLSLGLSKIFLPSSKLNISFTHFYPCPCGSIISGYLLPFVANIAFSVEKVSDGNPCFLHICIVTGDTKKFVKTNLLFLGKSRDCTVFSQTFLIKSSLYSLVKGPA